MAMYFLTLAIMKAMLTFPGYYGAWVEVMSYGYSFLIPQMLGSSVTRLVTRSVKKRVLLIIPMALGLVFFDLLSGPIKGLISTGLNTVLFVPMVMTFTPGLATLGLIWAWYFLRKDIVKETADI